MLPEQFCVRMKEMLGEEYAAFYASYDLPKYQALRINPRGAQQREERTRRMSSAGGGQPGTRSLA